MTFWPFRKDQMGTISEALDISEDKTGDYYKFSSGQWKRYRYDLKTLSSLQKHQIVPDAFAVLNKATRPSGDLEPPSKNRDYYFICLQDHEILKALRRDKGLGLLPLMVYVLTHELVHIVRFTNFLQRFDISDADRAREEEIVHGLTHEILKNTSLSRLDYVLESYRTHRVCRVGTAHIV